MHSRGSLLRTQRTCEEGRSKQAIGRVAVKTAEDSGHAVRWAGKDEVNSGRCDFDGSARTTHGWSKANGQRDVSRWYVEMEEQTPGSLTCAKALRTGDWDVHGEGGGRLMKI